VNEQSIRRLREVVVGLAVGALATDGSYVVVGPTSAFVAAPVHHAVVQYMPAPVLAFSIVVLGELGDSIGFAIALALAAVAFGAAYWVAVRVSAQSLGRVVLSGGLVWLGAVALTGSPTSGVGAALAAGAGVAVVSVSAPQLDETVSPGRRRTIALLGSTVGFGALAFLLGDRPERAAPSRSLSNVTGGAAASNGSAPAGAAGEGSASNGTGGGSASPVQSKLQLAADRSLDVAGVDGLVSKIGLFYTVDIDTIDPSVDPAAWHLDVVGSVSSPTRLTFDDLTSQEPIHRFKTLRCVGEHRKGQEMDNALWTGVPMSRILERVDPTGGHVVLHAADGYAEEFPIEALREGMLAYGMNDKLLPRQHGRPVRALVPGHWGEINVKWLTKIEVRDDAPTGYWEKRGWHGTGPVNTVAKLWTVNHLDGGRVQVAGFAYAGTRGVQAVEVSTDGGSAWTRATLSDPLPGDDVWRQWEHTWQPTGASAEVVVRAVDGTGARQPKTEAGPYPNGASGWVRKTVRTGGHT